MTTARRGNRIVGHDSEGGLEGITLDMTRRLAGLAELISMWAEESCKERNAALMASHLGKMVDNLIAAPQSEEAAADCLIAFMGWRWATGTWMDDLIDLAESQVTKCRQRRGAA